MLTIHVKTRLCDVLFRLPMTPFRIPALLIMAAATLVGAPADTASLPLSLSNAEISRRFQQRREDLIQSAIANLNPADLS